MEFELIKRYFSRVGAEREDVVLGVGDDAAILLPPAGCELVVSMDTLVSGVHFYSDVDPVSLGHKALAVNLSDLAAMGAEPAWATLGLTLPEADDTWLSGFSRGFSTLAQQHGVRLVGGDTTCGPLSITVQLSGFVKQGRAWRRGGARPGDLIYVSGTLGDAGLALQAREQSLAFPKRYLTDIQQRLERPTPRTAEALALGDSVSAAVDLSDGLLSDLEHVLDASGVGAEIRLAALPLSPSFIACQHDPCAAHLSGNFWHALPLTAGDDYELCFTVRAEKKGEVERCLRQHGIEASCIGVIDELPGLRCLQDNGERFQPEHTGYEHFSGHF